MKPVYFSKYIYFLIPSGDYSNAADATYNVIFLLTSCLATPAGWWSDVSFFLHVFHSLSYFNSIFLSIAVTHHYLSLSLLFSRPIILNPATPPQSFFLFFFKFYRYLWSPRFRNQIKTWYSTKCWDFNKNKKGKKDLKKKMVPVDWSCHRTAPESFAPKEKANALVVLSYYISAQSCYV